MRTALRTRNSSRPHWAILSPPLVLLLAVLPLAGCGASQPPPEVKRFQLQGEVLVVDAPHRSLIVKHGDIPGFMAAMAMPYTVADPRALEGLGAGDQIRAEVVVTGAEVHLEKISVIARVKGAAPPSSPQPGVPLKGGAAPGSRP
jgi:Cu/Ag efflux protein CusF